MGRNGTAGGAGKIAGVWVISFAPPQKVTRNELIGSDAAPWQDVLSLRLGSRSSWNHGCYARPYVFVCGQTWRRNAIGQPVRLPPIPRFHRQALLGDIGRAV